MKRQRSISVKIAAAVGILVLGYALSMGLNSYEGLRQEQRLAVLSSHAVPSALSAQAALFTFNEAAKSFEDTLLTGDDSGLPVVQEKLERLHVLLGEVRGHRVALATDVALLDALDPLVARYGSGARPLFETIAAKGMADAAVQEQANAFRSLTASAQQELTALAGVQSDSLREALGALERGTRQQRFTNLGLFGVFIFFGIGTAVWVVRRSVVRPVLRLTGDLSHETSGVEGAAVQLRQASEALASGASQSAASLETSAAALEEMAGVTRANAERAQQAKDLAARARQAADSGSGGMKDLSSAMSAIQTASGNIAAIIKTIDEIAFQTNILALNAAVEAARAGEAGAGFAVVADEVRALAQRSAKAARETADKIEQSTKSSAEGAALSGRVGQHLGDIVARVREVDELVAQIAASSHEQDQGIQQVSRSMAELDQLTQRNAAMAEESSASAHELGQQTQRLRDVADAFTLLARGGVATGHPSLEGTAGGGDSGSPAEVEAEAEAQPAGR